MFAAQHFPLVTEGLKNISLAIMPPKKKARGSAASATTCTFSDRSDCSASAGTNSENDTDAASDAPPARQLGRTPSSPYRLSKLAKKASRAAKKKMPKSCKICKAKVTDYDPSFNDGATVIMWGEKKKKGRVCRYCRKVHIKKHKKKPLKVLLVELEKDGAKEKYFLELRSTEIKLMQKRIKFLKLKMRRTINADDLDGNEGSAFRESMAHILESSEEVPKESAFQANKKRQRNARRGQWIRLDIFKEDNPNVEPAKEHFFWRTGKGEKAPAHWVKIYKNARGIEDFTSDSEVEVVHQTNLDSGRGVLDDDQVRATTKHTQSPGCGDACVDPKHVCFGSTHVTCDMLMFNGLKHGRKLMNFNNAKLPT